jgi:hypothetical protein
MAVVKDDSTEEFDRVSKELVMLVADCADEVIAKSGFDKSTKVMIPVGVCMKSLDL